MGEDREPHFREAVPQGFCKKGCLAPDNSPMPLIKQGNDMICPQCQVSSPPSGLVNEFDDPGHDAMDKILKTNDPKQLPKVKEFKNILHPVTIMKEVVEEMEQKHGLKIQGYPTYEVCLQYIQNLPMPDNMRDIRKILKIKQLLTELVQGENN